VQIFALLHRCSTYLKSASEHVLARVAVYEAKHVTSLKLTKQSVSATLISNS